MVLLEIPNSLPAILRREVFLRAEIARLSVDWNLNSFNRWELRLSPQSDDSIEDLLNYQKMLQRYFLERVAYWWGNTTEAGPLHGG